MGYQLKTSEFLLLSLFCIASKKLFIHVAKILVSSFFLQRFMRICTCLLNSRIEKTGKNNKEYF